MEVKVLELRDRATFIPILCVRLKFRDDLERYLCARAGFYNDNNATADPYVIMHPMTYDRANYDPYAWSNPRTFGTAHKWIIENWDDLKSGDVVDVEFILGETKTKKRSERETILGR